MIHISQEELLKKIEQEHQQLLDTNSEIPNRPIEVRQSRDMSSILPTTCGLRDRNNNSVANEDDDEVKAVLITGEILSTQEQSDSAHCL